MFTPDFIKVGDSVINTSFIAHVSREGATEGVIRIWSKNPNVYWDYEADSVEAQGIADYFENPDVCLDLAPKDEDKQQFQLYRQRGGCLPFADFLTAWRQQQRLVRIEEPSPSQLNEASRLEGILKL